MDSSSLGHAISLDLLKSIDETLHSSLTWILNNDIENIIFETFSVTNVEFGITKSIDLIPGGADVEVNNKNKADYVKLMLQYRTVKAIEKPLNALLAALYEMVPFELLSTFTLPELDLLLNGKNEIDVGDIRSGVSYTGELVS